MEICPYCGTRHPIAPDAAGATPPRCSECGGVLDDLSMKATQIAMGPWYFRQPGKPFVPGCDITVLRRMLVAGKLKPESPVRGPATHQLWRRVKYVPGIAHLTGACHACGAGVKHDNKFCPSCGVKFEMPDARDQWGLPSTPPAEQIAKVRVIDGKLCPVCGHDKASGDECSECETIFAPADEATPVHLGGWFIHGKAHAYKPGISYEQLKKEITVGSVTARTVLRGPTTNQFWTLAKSAPGVAHLLGVCHSCGGKVDPSGSSCGSCGAVFALPPAENTVGLRYPTADAALKAQQELDDALAALGPAAFTSSSKMAGRATPAELPVDDEAAATVDEMELETRERSRARSADADDAGHAEPAHDEHDEAHDEPHVEHSGHAEHAAHEAHDEPAMAHAGAAADRGGFEVHAEPTARRPAPRQSSSPLVAVLIVVPLLLIGGYFVITSLSGKGGGDAPAKDAKAADKGAPKKKREVTPEMAQLRRETESRWVGATKGKEPSPKLSPLFDKGAATLASAHKLYDEGDYDEADAEYRRVFPIIDEVERVLRGRGIADDARTRAMQAKDQAKQLEAPTIAKELWDKAEATFAAATTLLQQEDVAKASEMWEQSIDEYGKSARFVQAMREAADARTQIEAEGTKKYPKAELDAHNIPAWQAFQAKLKAGDEYAAAKDFLKAKDYYDQARLMVPSVEFAMQLEIGRIWYAYQAGRLTTRILLAKAATYHPDEEMLAQLKLAYENMQINRDFFNRIPKSKNCSYKELADVMIVECGKEIETAFGTEGEAYKNSFALGMQFMIVDKLLRVDVGKLTPATRTDLELHFRKVMPDAAKAAGFAGDVVAFFKEADETLGTEQNIPVKTRELWAGMMEKLDKFETAMPLMKPKK